MESQKRFGWGTLILGLLLGAAGGLGYAWLINPVQYAAADPRQLSNVSREKYILLVGYAYSADFDLARAQHRLAVLAQPDTAAQVSALADYGYLHGGSPDDIRALTMLAEALGAHPQAAEVFSGTVPSGGAGIPASAIPSGITASPTLNQQTPTVTLSPDITETATATATLIPQNVTMKLTILKPICADDGPSGQLQLYVIDAAGGGIPAVKVEVTWDGGSDAFFTGLKPEISPGFADFDMEKDHTYSVTLPGLSEPVVGLSSAACLTESGQVSTPSYQLVFQPIGP